MARVPYLGHYINLDRSFDRRAQIEDQLRLLNLDCYTRIPATDGAGSRPGKALVSAREAGCFDSHYRAVEAARGCRLPVHIIEDDVILSPHLEAFLEYAAAARLFDRYDIICTETLVEASALSLRHLMDAMGGAASDGSRGTLDVKLIDLSTRGMAGATSYFIGPNSVGRVLDVLKSELERGPTMPLDLYFDHAMRQGLLRIGCTVPFLTSIRLEHAVASTISDRDQYAMSFDVAMHALLRYSFFINRDFAYAKRYLDQVVDRGAESRLNPHYRFIADIVGMIVAGPAISAIRGQTSDRRSGREAEA